MHNMIGWTDFKRHLPEWLPRARWSAAALGAPCGECAPPSASALPEWPPARMHHLNLTAPLYCWQRCISELMQGRKDAGASLYQPYMTAAELTSLSEERGWQTFSREGSPPWLTQALSSCSLLRNTGVKLTVPARVGRLTWMPGTLYTGSVPSFAKSSSCAELGADLASPSMVLSGSCACRSC